LGSVAVIPGLLLVGVGEGTLLTLLFNVLVSASPKRLAGDVGALRGVANNVSNALGAALASVVAVGLLGVFLASAFSRSDLPPELRTQARLDSVDFVTDEQLRAVLGATSAMPEQVGEAVAINEDARLRALRASFFVVGGKLPLGPAVGTPRRRGHDRRYLANNSWSLADKVQRPWQAVRAQSARPSEIARDPRGGGRSIRRSDRLRPLHRTRQD